MFSSQLLLGKRKCDLSRVWMAAHFPKRVKKDLVDETNITSSVDKILEDGLQVVSYRVLGYLLLGVARIYSKKVDYLLVDSYHTLNEVKFFGREKADVNFEGMCAPESSTQRSKHTVVDVNAPESSRRIDSNASVDIMRAQFSQISMPESFNLDAYYLEPLEDSSSNDHVRPHLELVLNDEREAYRTASHTFGKDHASASTSAMITNFDPSTSAEKFRHRFSLEDRLDPLVLSDSDDELALNSIPLIQQEPEWNNPTDSSDMVSVRVENEDCTTTAQTVGSETTPVNKSQLSVTIDDTPQSKAPVIPETTPVNKSQLSVTVDDTPQSKAPVIPETTPVNKSQLSVTVDDTPQSKAPVIPETTPVNKSQLSVTVDVTPPSKAPVDSGKTGKRKRKSEVVAVITPATRESVRAPRKRKCTYDYPVVILNEEYKTWVSSASDLVRKRRTRTAVFDTKERHAGDDFFSQPVIPINAGFPSDLRSVLSKIKLTATEEVGEPMEVDPTNTISKNDELGPSNADKVPVETEAEVIAPQTPATQTSFRFPVWDVDLDNIQRDEGLSSLEENNQENDNIAEKWSAVTKSVGGYLHGDFVRRTEKGENEAINLSHILKGKTRTESTKFFYQILVLKTGGCIDVKQEKPYGEICVKQTPKLKEVFGN